MNELIDDLILKIPTMPWYERITQSGWCFLVVFIWLLALTYFVWRKP